MSSLRRITDRSGSPSNIGETRLVQIDVHLNDRFIQENLD
jgi:hypothetical protein